jgi:hypothetical protein
MTNYNTKVVIFRIFAAVKYLGSIMKKVSLLFGLVILLICTASRCQDKESENCHTAIGFSNNSTKNLYVRGMHYIPRYPFASEVGYIHSTVNERYKVKSGEQSNRKAMSSSGCHEDRFDDDYYSDTFIVYIFDAAVVENTPWEIVARDYLVLKRYDLTLEDLQRLDWKITYPPTEMMKDVKQWPPYEE